jgi:hypothetical protein
MSSTTFAFALLAGNDLDKVAHTLKTIAAQETGAHINTKIIIAHDDASLTEEWVRTALEGTDMSVLLVPLALESAHPQARRASMLAALATAIPEDVEWVWTLTDDASLYSKFSLEQLTTQLGMPAHKDVRFVHACLAPKSYDTGYTQMASVKSLCESHGYFEILGAPSAMVLTADAFRLAFGKHLAEMAEQARSGDIRITPFTHCQLLYLALADTSGLLIDSKLVAQERGTTFDEDSDISESRQMFMIAGELVELAHILKQDNSWDTHFFRFGQKSIWTELLHYQSRISSLFDHKAEKQDAEVVAFIDNWQVLLTLADHVNDKETASIIRNVVTNGIRYTLELLHGEEDSLKKLENFFASELANDLVYPSTLLRPDHMMQLMRKSA